MAQSVTVSGIDALEADIKQLLEELPEKKRALHERLAKEIRMEVVNSLGNRAKSNSGKVAEMQGEYVGSGGGYAAVRPKANMFYKGYAYGYITNALENGHAIKKPSGRWKKYRARVKNSYVLGLHFYSNTAAKVEKMAIDEANRLADEIKQALE